MFDLVKQGPATREDRLSILWICPRVLWLVLLADDTSILPLGSEGRYHY